MRVGSDFQLNATCPLIRTLLRSRLKTDGLYCVTKGVFSLRFLPKCPTLSVNLTSARTLFTRLSSWISSDTQVWLEVVNGFFKLIFWRVGSQNLRILFSRPKRDNLVPRVLSYHPILGDPGAVSRAGLKGATKVFKHGQKSPWVPTLTGPFPNGQKNAGSWLGTKNALYYCAQSANSFSWVLFVSSYTTAIISPQSETRELPMSRKTFRMLSAGAIQFALRKFWRITMYRK